MPERDPFETDTLATSDGELQMTFLGHGSLLFDWKGASIHVDPYGRVANYERLPKADLVLITHEHADHFDREALAAITTPSTVVVSSALAAREIEGAIVMANGDARLIAGLPIEAVPAYNIVHLRPSGAPYHPRGAGNGYVVTFGDKRVYVAGDTEDIPEMASLTDITVAFLPMNVPYTMTPIMAAAAARMIGPRVVYPYHYGETDPLQLAQLLAANSGIEVRIRRLS